MCALEVNSKKNTPNINIFNTFWIANNELSVLIVYAERWLCNRVQIITIKKNYEDYHTSLHTQKKQQQQRREELKHIIV